jgi:hypothetical protein
MKKLTLIILVLFVSVSYSQFKDPGFPTSNVKEGIISNSFSPLFGFLNSDNFQMKHSYSLSYSSFAGQGLALGVYTNSMFYKFSDNLDVQVDASLVHSPYSSFGKDFQNSLTGFYINRAALNYRPWEDVFISVQYRNLPSAYYYPYGGFFGNRYLNRNPYGGWFFE